MLKRYPSLLLAMILLAGCSAATAGRIIVGGARVIAGVPASAPTAEPTTPPPAPTPRQPQCDDISGPKCDCWRWAVPADVWDACVRETPTPWPTVQPTAAPTATPSPTAIAAHLDTVPCARESAGKLHKYVKAAILEYQKRHPERFLGNRLAPVWWDAYYFEVVEIMNAGGFVKAVVDDCGGAGICGEIAVKEFEARRGFRYHEQYHVLVSSGDIRTGADSYRATCEPAGF